MYHDFEINSPRTPLYNWTNAIIFIYRHTISSTKTTSDSAPVSMSTNGFLNMLKNTVRFKAHSVPHFRKGCPGTSGGMRGLAQK